MSERDAKVGVILRDNQENTFDLGKRGGKKKVKEGKKEELFSGKQKTQGPC